MNNIGSSTAGRSEEVLPTTNNVVQNSSSSWMPFYNHHRHCFKPIRDPSSSSSSSCLTTAISSSLQQCDRENNEGGAIIRRPSQVGVAYHQSFSALTTTELTPPPSPFDRNKMIIKTPSSIRTAETIATTPDTSSIASCASYLSVANSSLRTHTPNVTATAAAGMVAVAVESRILAPPVVVSSFSGNTNSTNTFNLHELPNKYGRLKRKKTNRSQNQFNVRCLNFDNCNDKCTRMKPQLQQQKIKTELCLYYVAKKPCPFGSNCTYAHGEKELQMKKLMDLQREGLIDSAETYRTKPCFDFVAMGSCPYGRRCSEIHDTRVAGKRQSWLPITETQGNNLATDVNVESMYQKRRFEILAGNPLGVELSPTFEGWNDLYNLVSNLNSERTRMCRYGGYCLTETQKIQVALQFMCGHKWMYRFCPTHIIFQEFCMILETRVFQKDTTTGGVSQIDYSEYDRKNPEHIVVREIAFGPDQDPSVDRHTSLYFNISEDKITVCTQHQQTRFRWKKQRDWKRSNFEGLECFVMIRPNDKDAFNLCTNILHHRLDTIKAEQLASINKRFALEKVSKNHNLLYENFLQLARYWKKYAYISGKRILTNETPVPPVETEYDMPIISKSQAIWESFVRTMLTQEGSDNFSQHDCGDHDRSHRRRLPVFEKLSNGQSINQDYYVPHITRCNKRVINNGEGKYNMKVIDSYDGFLQQRSESCWKSLLLKSKNPKEDEWNVVKQHFCKEFSRSLKVLNILQQ